MPHAINIKKFKNNNYYIARKKNTSRNFFNLDEIENFLISQMNFTKIYLEDLSIIEQISIFNNAKYIIGIHGAGLSNIVFCNKKVKIFEIMPEIRINSLVCSIAMILKLKYFPFIIRSKDVSRDGRLMVDVKLLKKFLLKIIY